ncbi:MAG: methyltransferase domain-containing protein [Xenococcus sp. MO_188.B8]|nr:methyltransferase domain-containing protein [Xenococcus sp. MO_188.B8]
MIYKVQEKPNVQNSPINTSHDPLEDCKILGTEHHQTLVPLLKFEIKSFYGRFFQKKPPLKKQEKNLLHLGCGPNHFSGWINADFFLKPIIDVFSLKPDWMLDLRYPLKCDDNVWDGVFSEHVIEHLYPHEVLNLLRELNRTMKPGSWLRITVPDLRKYIQYYCDKSDQSLEQRFSEEWNTGCEAISSLTQNYGHFSAWDSQLLELFFAKAGFTNIKEVAFRQGTDKVLLMESEGRRWETLYMEAQKPVADK